MEWSILEPRETWEGYLISQKPWEGTITYQVTIKPTLFLPKKVTDSITYHVDVDCFNVPQNNLLHYKFTRKQKQLNENTPKTVFQEVVFQISSVFDVLHFSINRISNNILFIENYKQIVRKWENLKETLYNNVTGDVIENYLLHTNRIIHNEELLLNHLLNDPFVAVFLAGYYNKPHTNNVRYNSIAFYASENFIYDLEYKYYKEDNMVTMVINGESKIDEEKQKQLKKYLQKTNSYTVPYDISLTKSQLHKKVTINEETSQIESIYSNQELEVAQQPIKRLQINIQKTKSYV